MSENKQALSPFQKAYDEFEGTASFINLLNSLSETSHTEIISLLMESIFTKGWMAHQEHTSQPKTIYRERNEFGDSTFRSMMEEDQREIQGNPNFRDLNK